jgi:hypothetical protein
MGWSCKAHKSHKNEYSYELKNLEGRNRVGKVEC